MSECTQCGHPQGEHPEDLGYFPCTHIECLCEDYVPTVVKPSLTKAIAEAFDVPEELLTYEHEPEPEPPEEAVKESSVYDYSLTAPASLRITEASTGTVWEAAPSSGVAASTGGIFASGTLTPPSFIGTEAALAGKIKWWSAATAPGERTRLLRDIARDIVNHRKTFVTEAGVIDWAGRSWAYRSSMSDVYARTGLPETEIKKLRGSLRYHLSRMIRREATGPELDAAGLKPTVPILGAYARRPSAMPTTMAPRCDAWFEGHRCGGVMGHPEDHDYGLPSAAEVEDEPVRSPFGERADALAVALDDLLAQVDAVLPMIGGEDPTIVGPLISAMENATEVLEEYNALR